MIFMKRRTLPITLAALMCMAMLYSCASAPSDPSALSAPREADPQVLEAREKMEKARKQAQDFGGAEYAGDEWGAAERIYNAVRAAQPANQTERDSALADMQNAASGYESAFQKAIPQYAEARKGIVKTARDKAVAAGAGNLAADMLAGADQKDKDSLAQFDQKDYYGYQKTSQDAEALYDIIAVRAAALSAKQDIDANKLARFDPENYEAANQSMGAAKTAYDGQDLNGMKTAAEDALSKYQQVLDKGRRNYADERKQLADEARAKAVAARADTVLKNDFEKAGAVYNQGNDDFSAGNYKPAADSFDRSQQLYAALTANAEKLQKDATAALQLAQKKVSDSQTKAKAVPGADNNPHLKKALEDIAAAQRGITQGDYPGALASAAEAQKNAGLSDDFTAQMQKGNAAKQALAAAKTQMDGVPNDARVKYTAQYKTATDAYADGVKAQNSQDWNTVTADAKKIVDAVAAINKSKTADDATEKKTADTASAALAAAKKRMDGVNADDQKTYAAQYKTAADAYADGVKAQSARNWDTVNADVKKIHDALDQMDKAIAAAEEALRKTAEEAASAALAAAKRRMDGVSADDQQTYVVQYKTAADAYADGVKAQSARNWDTVNADVKKIHDALDQMEKDIAAADLAASAEKPDDSAEQQRIKEANDAIAAAKDRLDWAQGVNAPANFPENYAQADEAYTNAENALSAENWDDAIAAANAVMQALASVTERAPLPSQYTVRTWVDQRDCLWNIAGYSWVYNDPWQWRRLYEANRDKLPDANNADEIEIGTILDIPSIRDEFRQGMWDESKEYASLSPR